MSASAWVPFLIPIAIGLSPVLCRRIFPLPPVNGAVSPLPLTDEELRFYRRWEVGAILPFFIFAPLLGFAWYFVLNGAAGLFQHDATGSRFLVRPSPLFCAMPAIFLGVTSSAVPIDLLYRYLLRDRYHRYTLHSNEHAGFDQRRAFSGLATVVAVGASVGFVGIVTCYARFDDVGVEIRRPFGIRSKYCTYKSVKSIEHRVTVRAPNKGTVQGRYYVITFGDGTTWSTLHDPVPEVHDQVAKLVAQKSGRPIIEHP